MRWLKKAIVFLLGCEEMVNDLHSPLEHTDMGGRDQRRHPTSAPRATSRAAAPRARTTPMAWATTNEGSDLKPMSVMARPLNQAGKVESRESRVESTASAKSSGNAEEEAHRHGGDLS